MTYLKPLHKALKAHANSIKAAQIAKYMRNLFDFHGINAPFGKKS